MTCGLAILPDGRASAVQVLDCGRESVVTDIGTFRWCGSTDLWRHERYPDVRLDPVPSLSAAALDELRRLRDQGASCPTLVFFLERHIAARGDAADPELIALQHELAELLPPPAISPERSTLP